MSASPPIKHLKSDAQDVAVATTTTIAEENVSPSMPRLPEYVMDKVWTFIPDEDWNTWLACRATSSSWRDQVSQTVMMERYVETLSHSNSYSYTRDGKFDVTIRNDWSDQWRDLDSVVDCALDHRIRELDDDLPVSYWKGRLKERGKVAFKSRADDRILEWNREAEFVPSQPPSVALEATKLFWDKWWWKHEQKFDPQRRMYGCDCSKDDRDSGAQKIRVAQRSALAALLASCSIQTSRVVRKDLYQPSWNIFDHSTFLFDYDMTVFRIIFGADKMMEVCLLYSKKYYHNPYGDY